MTRGAKFDAILALTNSVVMATIISGVLTAVNRGTGTGFLQAWAFSDAVAILVAFPTALVLLPRIRRLVETAKR